MRARIPGSKTQQGFASDHGGRPAFSLVSSRPKPSLFPVSVEELQEQLMSTTLELQNVREAARFQRRIDEVKICRLKGLLHAARKERDETKSKCNKLREHLLLLSHPSQAPLPAAGSPGSCFLSSISSTSSSAELSHPASSTVVDDMSLQDLRQNIRIDKIVPVLKRDLSVKLSPRQTPEEQEILHQSADISSVTMDDSQQQFSMDFLSEDVTLDEDLIYLNLNNYPSDWEQKKSNNLGWDVHLSHDSDSLLDKDAQHNSDSPNDQGDILLCRSSSVSSAGSDSFGGSELSKAPSSSNEQQIPAFGQSLCLKSSILQSSSMMASHSSHPTKVCRFLNETAHPSRSATQLKACLEEILDSEAGTLQVDALPEKGKFLQAVMQAGPLLKNLLLAGPLPQWRYPPPQLSTYDIPKVPTASGSLLMKYYSSLGSCNKHAMHTQHKPFVDYSAPVGHVSAPTLADEKRLLGKSMAPPNSSRSFCNGGQKFRRPSPTIVK